MSAELTVISTSRETTIKISGDFDFDINLDFKSAYRSLLPEMAAAARRAFVVDMGEVERIDSAGLGMLLVMLEHAKRQASEVVLLNPTAKVQSILEMVHFNRLFTIH